MTVSEWKLKEQEYFSSNFLNVCHRNDLAIYGKEPRGNTAFLCNQIIPATGELHKPHISYQESLGARVGLNE